MSALPLPLASTTTALGRAMLTVAEVADYLRISEMTVYRMITNQDLGATKIGRCWRVPAEDLKAYIKDRSTPATRAS